MKILFRFLLLLLLATMYGCATTGANSPEDKRQRVQVMKTQVLEALYAEKPSTRDQVTAAKGYAVFDNANVNVILASFGGGYGVVHNNLTGADTYMRMGEVGIGIGAGVRDFSVVFVFHSTEAIDYFIEYGWTFGAQADAAAKAGEAGAARSGEVVVNDVTIYQLTESGLALQATIKGTKFWVDKNLN